MSAILLILGIVVTGAGLAALGFGIPINEFSLGGPLIMAGTTALCGGLILIGLSAAVAELRRIGDLLKTRPMAQPARRAEAAPTVSVPAPAPTATIPPAPPVQAPPYTGPPPPAPVALGPGFSPPQAHGPAVSPASLCERSSSAATARKDQARIPESRHASRRAAGCAAGLDGCFGGCDRAAAVEHSARPADQHDRGRGSPAVTQRKPSAGACTSRECRACAGAQADAGRPAGWGCRRYGKGLAPRFPVQVAASGFAASRQSRSELAARSSSQPRRSAGCGDPAEIF